MQVHLPDRKLKYFVFTDDPSHTKGIYGDIENLYVVEGNIGEKIVIAPNKAYTGCKNPFVCDGWVKI